MGFDWHDEARRCFERLSQDFVRIKRESIDSGNYARAYEEWQFALMDSQYLTYTPYIIADLFRGLTFAASAEMLRNALEDGHKRRINFASRSLLACIAQNKMRREASDCS